MARFREAKGVGLFEAGKYMGYGSRRGKKTTSNRKFFFPLPVSSLTSLLIVDH